MVVGTPVAPVLHAVAAVAAAAAAAVVVEFVIRPVPPGSVPFERREYDTDVCLALDGVTEVLEIDGERLQAVVAVVVAAAAAAPPLPRPPPIFTFPIPPARTPFAAFGAIVMFSLLQLLITLPPPRPPQLDRGALFTQLAGVKFKLKPLSTLPALIRRTVDMWCAFTYRNLAAFICIALLWF